MSKGKVLVGMSGGVDSSVAAAVLLEQGYEVVGATLKLKPEDNKSRIANPTGTTDAASLSSGADNAANIVSGTADDETNSSSAVEDAQKVAMQLGIKHYVFDFTDIFKKEVIDYFTNEYLAGRTPNPCIVCNRHLKFGAMLNKAMEMGIDHVATGHYARITYDTSSGRFLLKKSATSAKDQTYALYRLTQEQLSRAIFPLEGYSKEQVRNIAGKLSLPVATKPDSMEICFIEDDDYSRYVQENTNTSIKPGYFVDTKGNRLGMHRGIINYTVGQRKGLGISFGKPVYVVAVRHEDNSVVLGDESDVFSNSLTASYTNYISIPDLTDEMRVKAKIRYSAREADAVIKPLAENRVCVHFDEPQRAVTPGQSVVFYDGDTIVGGGVID